MTNTHVDNSHTSAKLKTKSHDLLIAKTYTLFLFCKVYVHMFKHEIAQID